MYYKVVMIIVLHKVYMCRFFVLHPPVKNVKIYVKSNHTFETEKVFEKHSCLDEAQTSTW